MIKVQYVYHWPIAGVSYHKINVVAEDDTAVSVVVPDPIVGKPYTQDQAVNLASLQGPDLLKAKQRGDVIVKAIEDLTKPIATASTDQVDFDKYITELKAKMAAVPPVKPVASAVGDTPVTPVKDPKDPVVVNGKGK